MTQELTTHELPITQNLDHPMSAGELTKQALLIQEILEKVMVEDVHYGIIPGTGNKKTLYQPGAEKICSTFHLAPKYAVDDLSEPHNNFYRYRVACSLYTIRDGSFVGSACGEATSAEEKYQWERAVCPEHFEATDPSRRRVKYKKGEGESFSTINQVQRNAADLSNTILKIACKRAFVSATRGATAASDLLEVDLDEEAVADLAKAQRVEEQPTAKPKAKAKPAPTFNYGKHVGKQITDPSIEIGYLEFMADSTAKQLDDPAKAKFKAQNQLFLAALDAEIAHRKAEAAQQPEKTPEIPAKPAEASLGTTDTGAPVDSNRKPFSESAWADIVLMFEEDFLAHYTAVKAQFGVGSAHELPAGKRISFYDAVMAKAHPVK